MRMICLCIIDKDIMAVLAFCNNAGDTCVLLSTVDANKKALFANAFLLFMLSFSFQGTVQEIFFQAPQR